MKGLPSTYDKDLQEDKVLVFSAYDTLAVLLPVLSGALDTLTVHPKRMRAAIDPSLMATDLADYLVKKGVPFRQAHGLVGQAVQRATALGVTLSELPGEVYQELSQTFSSNLYDVFDPWRSVNQHNVPGGTALQAVQDQLSAARIASEVCFFDLARQDCR